jgi:hypothetical protein
MFNGEIEMKKTADSAGPSKRTDKK